MNVEITERVNRIAVVAPTGRVDAFNAPSLRTQLEEIFQSGVIRFVIDLSLVSFLDSAGLAVLVSLLKWTRQKDGDVRLVWPKEEGGKRILRLTKFDRVFEMSESADAAVASF